MVLDGEQVVAEPVGEARRLEHPLRVTRVGDQEVAELQRVAVVHGSEADRLSFIKLGVSSRNQLGGVLPRDAPTVLPL